MTRPALLIVGHGTKSEAGCAQFAELVERAQLRAAYADVAGGFIELAPPPIQEAVKRLVEAGRHGEEQTQHRREGDRGRELPAAQLLEETRPHRRVASPSAASGRRRSSRTVRRACRAAARCSSPIGCSEKRASR